MRAGGVISIATLICTGALVGCSGPVPIPDSPGIFRVEAFVGTPARPKPLPPKDVVPHPFLGENSVFHEEHYNSDVSDRPAVLGLNPKVVTRLYGVCSTPRLDSKGRVVTLCLDARSELRPGLRLVLLDGDSLDLLAERRVDDAPIGTVTGGDVPGGSYPHVDAEDRVITVSLEGSFNTFAALEGMGGALQWELLRSVDLSPYLGEGDVLFDAAPDFAGTVWFASGLGRVGYIDPVTERVFTTDLPGEKVENGFAVGEDGVFIVTSRAAYRFEIDPATGEPVFTWREAYDVDPDPKPGLLSEGSGATVTLLGRDLLALTDNAPGRVHLLVLRRGRDVAGDRLLCKVPLFEDGKSGVEVSPIGYERSLVVANYFGAPDTLALRADHGTLEPGLLRIDVRPDETGCDVVWTNDTLRSTTPSKLSTVTGLIYTFTQRLEEEPVDAWYLTAVDFETGEPVFDVLVGTGFLHRNGGLTTAIGPNGAVYQANLGGIVRVVDGVSDYWAEYGKLRRSERYWRRWVWRSRFYSLATLRREPPRIATASELKRFLHRFVDLRRDPPSLW